MRKEEWRRICRDWRRVRDLEDLKRGIAAGLLDTQDEYGLSAVYCAVCAKWKEGLDVLLDADPNVDLREFMHGTTPLYEAALRKEESIAAALVAKGANPDAPNYFGITPRRWKPEWFIHVPITSPAHPEPRIQNAVHLWDHHHPHFEIPDRNERESLQPGDAVNVYVYGPKSDAKQDTVKARISKRVGHGAGVRYLATVETPIERTHLRPDMTEVEFGPENVATVYVKK